MAASSASASANRGADSDDDWEYEYDDTETQDVYLSLDLTSHTTVAGPKKGFNKLEHDIFAEEARDKDKSRSQDQDANDNEEQGDDGEAEEDEDDQDRLQVVGLHTNNPIVSYQGQAFTCKWASTVGTDLFFARAPDHDPDPDDDQPPPLRQLGAFNMLGASSTRLVATAAKLRERTSAEQRGMETAGPSSSAIASNSTAPPAFAFAPTADIPHFFLPADATRAQKRQATFLENFAAVKARLGEKDEVRPNSFTSRGLNRPAAFNSPENDAPGPSTPRRATNGRQSVSFLSANKSTPANGNGIDSPQSPDSAASPSATEPAPTRARGRGRVGRPPGRGRGRGRGRPRSRGRGRGRGRKAVAADDGDGEGEGNGNGNGNGAGKSAPTPGTWQDAMTGVEATAASPTPGSVGALLTQQHQQQQERRAGDEGPSDAMRD